MTVRQSLVSIVILLVLLVRVSEVVFQLESFPLTHTGMFSDYQPTEKVPKFYTLEGRSVFKWKEVRPWMLRLSPDEVRLRLGYKLGTLSQRCGHLGDAYNRARPRPQRLRAMRVQVLERARPGTGKVDRVSVTACSLDPILIEAP